MIWISPEVGRKGFGRLAVAILATHLPATADSRMPVLEVPGNVLLFNGRPLRFHDPLGSWVSVLGEPSRTLEQHGIKRFLWDSLGLEIGGYTPPGGVDYVSRVVIHLADSSQLPLSEKLWRQRPEAPRSAFPGQFLFLGKPAGGGPLLFRPFQEAIKGAADFTTLGAERAERARMELAQPDGFRVHVHANLHCHSHPNEKPSGRQGRRRKSILGPGEAEADPCELLLDELELYVNSGTWD